MAIYDPDEMNEWLRKTLATPPSQRGDQSPNLLSGQSPDIPAPATSFTPAPSLVPSAVGQPAPNQFSQLADTMAKQNAKRAAMEQARKDEQKRKEEEEAERQKEIEMERTLRSGERADMSLANRLAADVFGGIPDRTANPNARRISPPSTQQKQFEITRNILYKAAQERRRKG